MTLLLTLLSCCWRWFDAVFPYTARTKHWLSFLYVANLDMLDHHSPRLPVLPLYLFVLETVFELYFDMMRPWHQKPPAWPFMGCALLVYQALDILSALVVVITTPGFLAKLMVALDLSFDLVLVYTAKLASFILIATSLAVVEEFQ